MAVGTADQPPQPAPPQPPPLVPLGPFVRAALAALLEQQAAPVIMGAVESWYAARGEPPPAGQWRLVIDAAVMTAAPLGEDRTHVVGALPPATPVTEVTNGALRPRPAQAARP